MATLKDVADLAGVSTATASLALNNGPVSEKTRARVIRCAKQLSYVPNRIGRMLTTGKSHTLELLIMTADRYTDIVRKTALFYYLLEGVLSVADEASYSLRFYVRSHDDPETPSYFERIVGDSSLDGIIIVPQFLRDYPFLATLQRAGFPYVLLRPPRFGGEAFNFVDMDNHGGGGIVAAEFMTRGCRRLALLNGPMLHVDAIERERGFTDALSGYRGADLIRKSGDFTIASGYAAMDEVLRDGFRPDAVFGANDYMAAGAMKRLGEAGLHVPGDVAVIGYDNTDICLGLSPSLTSVDNHFFELGRSLATGVLSLIQRTTPEFGVVVTPSLVSRDSHAA